jgi:hypothetical protein
MSPMRRPLAPAPQRCRSTGAGGATTWCDTVPSQHHLLPPYALVSPLRAGRSLWHAWRYYGHDASRQVAGRWQRTRP